MDSGSRRWLNAAMAQGATLEDQDFAADDVFVLVSALLEGIQRGELEASPKEVEFLISIERLAEEPSVLDLTDSA
jgi:hypothetical protein